ncbi:hypothetical protein [Staphylococcus gallinarum]|uniref:hypothetical protein n=1 Tax=Staphylococcus gallinarum TaxID=1293 RepID=UPI000D1DE8DE|nr:hypothetical protein [Staphylococcus gallinarum]PTK95468.1 hypothetical protein BUZ05_02930 [Staphylococcus gallinarum]PTK96385.1 hypothetical protein BUZ13_01155 [Staphylococcus gallinarum]
MEQRIRRKTAMVIKIDGRYYLSETGRIVDFNHAGIFNSPVIAKGVAEKFNDVAMNSIGMRYDLEIELVELEYKATGVYKKFTEDKQND